MLNAAAYSNRCGPDKSVPSRRTRQSIHRINCHAAYDTRGNVEYLGEQRFLYTATDCPRVRRSTGAGNGYGKYRYDGHGRRVSSWEREDGEWSYRYNAYDASGALVFIVEEENQFPYNDTITHYVKQDGKTVARVKSTSLNAAPEITWLHHDHLSNAVAGTKADGTTARTKKYTPYGISIVNNNDRFWAYCAIFSSANMLASAG